MKNDICQCTDLINTLAALFLLKIVEICKAQMRLQVTTKADSEDECFLINLVWFQSEALFFSNLNPSRDTEAIIHQIRC